MNNLPQKKRHYCQILNIFIFRIVHERESSYPCQDQEEITWSDPAFFFIRPLEKETASIFQGTHSLH